MGYFKLDENGKRFYIDDKKSKRKEKYSKKITEYEIHQEKIKLSVINEKKKIALSIIDKNKEYLLNSEDVENLTCLIFNDIDDNFIDISKKEIKKKINQYIYYLNEKAEHCCEKCYWCSSKIDNLIGICSRMPSPIKVKLNYNCGEFRNKEGQKLFYLEDE